MNGRTITSALIFALGCILASPALAEGDYKCTATTQECLDGMVAHYREKGWIGINLEWVESGTQMEVQDVVPDGPAFKAGIQTGDRIIAMNDVTFEPENKKKLAEVQKDRKPGVRFTLTVLRDGKARKILVTLGHMPDEIIASAIGPHMLEHVSPKSETPGKTEKTAKKERP